MFERYVNMKWINGVFSELTATEYGIIWMDRIHSTYVLVSCYAASLVALRADPGWTQNLP